MNRQYELAHTLIASRQSLAALDVGREPPSVRESYGPHRFGQCCLIARRLVEAGIPFVQVNWSTHVEGPEDGGDGGWDMHDRYFEVMQDRHGWMLDRALSALLDDLHDRGLLETTLIVAAGEFGRTPKINDRAGRDHWNTCYSALLAGGGVRGGQVIGGSDRRGEQPVDRPVTPADLGATILARLGIGTTDLTGIGLTPSGEVDQRTLLIVTEPTPMPTRRPSISMGLLDPCLSVCWAVRVGLGRLVWCLEPNPQTAPNDAPSNNPRVVRLTHDGLDKYRPSWAPDGHRLLFARREPDGSHIWQFVLDVKKAKSHARRLTDRKEPEYHGVFSPDGKRVLFAAITLSGTQGNLDIAVGGHRRHGAEDLDQRPRKARASGLALLVARWPAVRLQLDS